MNPKNFFAELKRRNVIPMDHADHSIPLSDLRTRWEWDALRNDPRFQKIPVDSYLAKRWRNL